MGELGGVGTYRNNGFDEVRLRAVRVLESANHSEKAFSFKFDFNI